MPMATGRTLLAPPRLRLVTVPTHLEAAAAKAHAGVEELGADAGVGADGLGNLLHIRACRGGQRSSGEACMSRVCMRQACKQHARAVCACGGHVRIIHGCCRHGGCACAPVASQSAEMELTEEMRCASMALAVSLDSSADHRLVHRMRSWGTQCAYTLQEEQHRVGRNAGQLGVWQGNSQQQ